MTEIETPKRAVAYTDGSCLNNPGVGGWAYVVDGGKWRYGYDPNTTNQRMEVTAAAMAVKDIQGPLLVVSDSTYVVNCFKNEWWKGWKRRGWRNSTGKPVANRDLWEPFIGAVLERGDVTFKWVKGHSGDAMNDVADELAVRGSKNQEAGRGAKYSGAVLNFPEVPCGGGVEDSECRA